MANAQLDIRKILSRILSVKADNLSFWLCHYFTGMMQILATAK